MYSQGGLSCQEKNILRKVLSFLGQDFPQPFKGLIQLRLELFSKYYQSKKYLLFFGENTVLSSWQYFSLKIRQNFSLRIFSCLGRSPPIHTQNLYYLPLSISPSPMLLFSPDSHILGAKRPTLETQRLVDIF
jgi:hypothetical protein